jgi:hypothetical protein
MKRILAPVALVVVALIAWVMLPGIPATYVIDRTGMIALRHIGAAAWDAERVVAFVGGLAAGPSGTFQAVRSRSRRAT